MLNRIIKGESSSRHPGAGFSPHSKPAIGRNIERQVDNRTSVSDPGMRRNAAVWAQQREERIGRTPWNPDEWQAFELRGCLRTAFNHRSVGPPVFPQKAGGPIKRTVKRRPVILRHTRVKLHIRSQRVARFRQKRAEFRSDGGAACLKLCKPWEVAAVKKLIGRQERVQRARTVVLVHLPPSLCVINKGADAARFSLIQAVTRSHDCGGGSRQLGPQIIAISCPFSKLGGNAGGELLDLGRQLLDPAPSEQRARFLALVLEQLRQPQVRCKIGLIKRQRAIKRSPLSGTICGQAVRMSQVAPQGSSQRVSCGGPLKRSNCLHRSAGPDRRQPFSIGALSNFRIGRRQISHAGTLDLPQAARKRELPQPTGMPKPVLMIAAARTDPEWFAHRYVESDDAFRLISLARTEHAAMPFLTDEYLGADRPAQDLPVAECLAHLNHGPLHFLFHSAFCGSTLVARALDRPGFAMGLSEPQVLNDVVGFRRRGAPPPTVARVADGALRLLGRTFGADAAVVVKPSNLINPLAELLLSLQPGARALFLYAPLETFLISVVRKGLHCRLWVRELLEGYLREGYAEFGFTPEDYFRQSDLQVAAIGWLAQHRHFAMLAAKYGPARIATLDADQLTAQPARAMEAIIAHYGLTANAAVISEIVAGPAFSQHSKSGAVFSAQQRAVEYAQARAAYGEEIGMVTVWAERVAETFGIAMAAPNPLLGQAA